MITFLQGEPASFARAEPDHDVLRSVASADAGEHGIESYPRTLCAEQTNAPYRDACNIDYLFSGTRAAAREIPDFCIAGSSARDHRHEGRRSRRQQVGEEAG